MEKRLNTGKLKTSPKIVVITGAESTGKSALAEWLANYFNAPYVPEFARSYIENLDRKYNYNDVELIARKQVDQLEKQKKMNHPLIFMDTWLIITKIWFEEVFDRVPEWIEPEIKNAKIDLFLLCDTDLPWEPDPVRENGGEQRLLLQKKYIETIQKNHFRYKIVSGKDKTRFHNALQHLKQLENS